MCALGNNPNRPKRARGEVYTSAESGGVHLNVEPEDGDAEREQHADELPYSTVARGSRDDQ